MAKTYNTIMVKNFSDIFEEYKAAAAITPGMLVEESGTAGTIKKHASAATFAMPMFAIEDEKQGKGIDDAYATDDKVQVWIPGRGDQVYALLEDNSQAITIGTQLVSAGNGKLRKSLDTINSYESVDAGMDLSFKSIVGVALEALDISAAEGSESSATGTLYPRILIRVV
ncbi:MAG: hypothetical protein WC516_09260 [Patescibacteria group bacterium]|jgi:hypothetical protein